MIFWAILASLVVVSVLYEARGKKKRRLAGSRRTWKSEIGRALRTMATFATIVILWSLWTAETVDQWLDQMSAYGNMTPRGALMIGGILAIIILLLYLRSPTSTLVVAIAIPICIIGTFLMMFLS